jgi:hypothetical protein
MSLLSGFVHAVQKLCFLHPPAPPSKNLLGHFYKFLNISSEPSAPAQSIGTLFERFGLKGGSVDMSKSQRHTRLGAGRWVSKANEAAISPNLQDCAIMR